MRNLHITPFLLLLLIIIALSAATFIEKYYGSSFVINTIYTSPWMISLWGLTVISGLMTCLSKRITRIRPLFLLHGAFILILTGAFLTHCTSQTGEIRLRNNKSPIQSNVVLPFDIKLDLFEINYYPGTRTPSDFISHIRIKENEHQERATISMNNIYSYKGYRFYQTSYDADLGGTLLSVSHDPYGLPITYTGYFLLMVSMLWLLVSPDGRYRKLLKLMPFVLLFLPGNLSAQRTLTQEQAAAFGRLSIYYGGRIAPLNTYAHDFTLKLTGKPQYKDFNEVQVLAGWLFFPEEWQKEPMIRLKNKNILRKLSDHDRVALADFFDEERRYKLSDETSLHLKKGIQEAEDKISLILSLAEGTPLKIFPQGNTWLSPGDAFTGNSGDSLFIASSLQLLYESLTEGHPAEPLALIEKIKRFQKTTLPVGTTTSFRTELEILYNRFNVPGFLFKINLLLGLLAFLYYVRSHILEKEWHWVRPVLYFQLAVSLLLITMYLSVRWYVSGHIPLSNGYETMLFISWCIIGVSFLVGRRSDLLLSGALLLSGFTLLVASLGMMDPQITNLVPVLMSPWLSIHVSLIMFSYALLAFIMLNSIAALLLHRLSSGNIHHTTELRTLSLVLLYPALFMLCAGIFIGAIWANESWGRYWGWDPKEVWALITMLIYSFALHSDTIRRFRSPLFFHRFTLFAFLSILMTYFGVSLFLGGLHAYQ